SDFEEIINLEEVDELDQLIEDGVSPMTPSPDQEEINFLAEDSPTFEEIDADIMDLSQAVIDEPDLSSEIQDNPVIEPSPEDITIDINHDETEPEPESDEVISDPLDTSDDSLESIEPPPDDISIDINFDETETEPESGEVILDPLDTSDDSLESIDISLMEEDIELPPDEEDIPISPETLDIEYSAVNLSDTAEQTPEDDLALIPEGFTVEADDIQPISEDDEDFPQEEPVMESAAEEPASKALPSTLKKELKAVLSYMDNLLETLPDDKIEEFARSEYFDTYKKLFKELGLV
ncbi:MAG: hypothetical protein LBH43_04570, partial [Treponema sp.]|nr:hypothetical protein [Treponema sp.]